MNTKFSWAAETSHPGMSEKIREALRTVKDPEIGMDLIQLGLIRNVEIHDQRVKIEMILTTPYCPYAPMLMEAARKKAGEAAGLEADIVYGREVWDRSMMEDDTTLNWGMF